MPDFGMATIRISRHLESSREAAWRKLADLNSHPEWMKDALDIEFITDQTSGLGTKMRVPTRVGPFRTEDVIEVTDWVEGHSIKVEHKGLVSGTGEFEILEDGSRSVIVWSEDLSFPWWLGGPVTAWLAAPILRRIWKGNLNRFATTTERSGPTS